MKVRLDFCDFGPGFSKTDNFFIRVLRKGFDVELCDKPDYLIFGDLGSHLHRVHNCIKIYFCVEDFAPDFKTYDYAFTCRYLDDPRHLRLPYYILGAIPSQFAKDSEDLEKIAAQKTKFCSFVISNVNVKKTRRVDFFHRLSKYKKVDSGGRYLNNIGASIPGGPLGKIEFLKPYKFNIAFENASVPGYTTEKLAEAMVARTLPIYWGNPRVQEEFNTGSFLNYADFPSEEALIEKIIELDRDPVKYLDYLRQPYFNNKMPPEAFNPDRLLAHFEKIFTQKIQPVSQRRTFFRLGRWIVVKKNKPHC